MLIVGTDDTSVESDLMGGRLACPACGGALGPWGHARWRVLRRREGELVSWRPRRGRCRSCRKTHVLLGDHSLIRRRDDADKIVWALVERARGAGYRRIATALGMRKVAETVRGWLRAFSKGAEVLRAHFTRWAYALDADLGPIAAHGDPLGDAVEAMAVAARAALQRHGPTPPSARVARLSLSGGALLCHTSYPLPAPGL